MVDLHRLITRLFTDRRPEREKASEREFILAANSLKTLSVTDRGGMSIDPEEIRDQAIASREQLKHLVHKLGAVGRPLGVSAELKMAQKMSNVVNAYIAFSNHPSRRSARRTLAVHHRAAGLQS